MNQEELKQPDPFLQSRGRETGDCMDKKTY